MNRIYILLFQGTQSALHRECVLLSLVSDNTLTRKVIRKPQKKVEDFYLEC